MNPPELGDLSRQFDLSGASGLPDQLTRSQEIDAACRLLRQCCAGSAPPAALSLQQALKQAVQASDRQILGICVDSLSKGRQVLADYVAALALPQLNLEFADLAGAVYIKFNPTGQSYATPYSGSERGVLVSCQSADETDVNELFGPLPLDLFAPDLHRTSLMERSDS